MWWPFWGEWYVSGTLRWLSSSNTHILLHTQAEGHTSGRVLLSILPFPWRWVWIYKRGRLWPPVLWKEKQANPSATIQCSCSLTDKSCIHRARFNWPKIILRRRASEWSGSWKSILGTGYNLWSWGSGRVRRWSLCQNIWEWIPYEEQATCWPFKLLTVES